MARAQGSPRRPTMSVLSVRIDSDTMKTLRSYIREGGDGNRSQSKAEVVRVALRRYLKAEGSYWDIVFKRLNRNASRFKLFRTGLTFLSSLFSITSTTISIFGPRSTLRSAQSAKKTLRECFADSKSPWCRNCERAATYWISYRRTSKI